MLVLLKLAGDHRKFLTLLAVCVAAVGVYVWGANLMGQRDQLAAWANTACAASGSDYFPSPGAKGAARMNGVACLAQVRQLAAFQKQVTSGTAEQLIAALEAREGKQNVDAMLARRAAEAARAASERMEKADAAVGNDNQVGGDWFGAVNQSAGLRPPAR